MSGSEDGARVVAANSNVIELHVEGKVRDLCLRKERGSISVGRYF